LPYRSSTSFPDDDAGAGLEPLLTVSGALLLTETGGEEDELGMVTMPALLPFGWADADAGTGMAIDSLEDDGGRFGKAEGEDDEEALTCTVSVFRMRETIATTHIVRARKESKKNAVTRATPNRFEGFACEVRAD
jgi:hypothetical protein